METLAGLTTYWILGGLFSNFYFLQNRLQNYLCILELLSVIIVDKMNTFSYGRHSHQINFLKLSSSDYVSASAEETRAGWEGREGRS
jgi:hypothetical protein